MQNQSNNTNGSTRVLQLVYNALALQGCNPGFIEGRNAILAAEAANTETGGADKCMIWNVFAKRGLGVNAAAGSKTNINDQVEDFTVPTECATAATSETGNNAALSIYPNPAKNEFYFKSAKNILGKGLIVHQGADDYVSQPAGNAGVRVACSAIIK